MKKNKRELLLAMDVGNTNVSAAVFDGAKMLARFYFPEERSKLAGYLKDINKVMVVSVAPARLLMAIREVRKFYKGKISIVGKDVRIPIKSAYNSAQIGQDRLVTAYAAAVLCGRPVLIVDFGTAVTFDVVSAKGEYLGGLILPGIKMSLESLHRGTAMLPEVVFGRARKGSFIGRNTQDSIRNGILFGYVSICEGLTKKFRNEFKGLKIIATGGNARLISSYTRTFPVIDDSLCLKGLMLLHNLSNA